MLDSKGRLQKKVGTTRARRLNVSDFYLGEIVEVKGVKFAVKAINKRNQQMTLELHKE